MVQVVDDLSLTFPAPGAVISASLLCTAGSCGMVTLDFTGPGDTTLLDPTSSGLTVASAVTLELSVTFDAGADTGPFTNTATASGDSPLGSNVDDSDSVNISTPPPAGVAVIGVAKEMIGVNEDVTLHLEVQRQRHRQTVVDVLRLKSASCIVASFDVE